MMSPLAMKGSTMLNAEVLHHFDKNIIREIVIIKRDSFPHGWAVRDAEEYYGGMLRSEKNIHIILNDNGKKAGYLLAIPQSDAVEELKNDDPGMKKDPKGYYIETVGILPESRGKKGLSLMLEKLVGECRKRGINKISLHARIINNFSKIIRKKFGTAEIRRIEKWRYYNFEEPTDYIEAVLP